MEPRSPSESSVTNCPTERYTRKLFDILQYDVLEYTPQEVLVQSRADGTTSLKVFTGDGWETSDSDAWRVT